MTIFTEPITTPQFEPFGQLIAAPESFGRQSFATGLSHGDRAPVLSTTHTPPFRLPHRSTTCRVVLPLRPLGEHATVARRAWRVHV